MGRKEPVTIRIDEDKKKKLENLANQNQEGLSAYTRSIINSHLLSEDHDADVRRELRKDIKEIGGQLEMEDSVVTSVINDAWDVIGDATFRDRVRKLVFEETNHVYIIGHGSSQSVAVWLAERLREQGISANADTSGGYLVADTGTGDVGGSLTTDTVIVISRSGETDVVQKAINRLEAKHILGVTKLGSSIAETADDVVPHPQPNEHLGPYATKSLIAAIVTLQVTLFDENPTMEDIERRFDAVKRLLKNEFGGDDSVTGLSQQSGFVQLAAELDAQDHLAADPIVPSMGWQAGVGTEIAQKLTELLFVHGDACDLAAVRDGVLNSVISGQGYFLTILPDAENEAYDIYDKLLFDHPEAIDTLLTDASQVGGSPIACLSFDADAKIERKIRNRSAYGDAAVVELSIPMSTYVNDPFTRELLGFVGGLLFTFALLCRRWPQDDQFKTHVIEDVYDTTTIPK